MRRGGRQHHLVQPRPRVESQPERGLAAAIQPLHLHAQPALPGSDLQHDGVAGNRERVLAVSTSGCPRGPLVRLADTGGTTMISTGRDRAPSGPVSRKEASVVRSGTVRTARPSGPVVASQAGRQAGWPAARSDRLSFAPYTARP